MPEPPLVTEQLGRQYRRNRPWAIRDLSISIPSGSIVALVGPNGSGKSTLIRSCLGFEVPDTGRVVVCGIDPQRRRAAAVEAIGYVPQMPSLYRGLTIDEHLTMAAAARSSFDRAYAARRISEAGLSGERRIGNLSGGEQAQVALTLALGTRAPLLLLDEPLASLDPLARRNFLAGMVADVRSRGVTVILSSHIVADLADTCDRVLVLVHGRLALESRVAEALQAFRTLTTEESNGQAVVGSFVGPGGGTLVLVRGGRLGRAATLEDIVLGHLATAASERAEVADA
jgi:ABC-2 type transport system ATP-binding protein